MNMKMSESGVKVVDEVSFIRLFFCFLSYFCSVLCFIIIVCDGSDGFFVCLDFRSCRNI